VNGLISGQPILYPDGAAVAGRRSTPMPWTVIRAAVLPVQPSRWRLSCAWQPLAPKQTVRLFAHPNHRIVGIQAYFGFSESQRDHTHLSFTGYGRTHGTLRGGCSYLLEAMAGADPQDPATTDRPGKADSGYTAALQPGNLQGIRIGVARNFFGFLPQVDESMEACLQALKDLGATLVDPANLKNTNRLGKHELEVLLYDFKTDLNAYLSGWELRRGYIRWQR